ncbi:cell division protein [Massilia sp. Root133]|uniref:SPOR domain-containing protein n=1 Tax=Massilia cellulosiltytica TaxID=2683234 RepID=A0A7X3K8K1_9BURK|nr:MULTISPECIES: SPOR domain-containing protein [Telluria group]KQY18633.1 cell division protein [Massilia sp. Root133]KQZ53815.1 cell division protein [Massilia sp. Root1485]MVW62028.1 SPOR domain-containing protein [Telluria cellulosilytica]
MTAFRNRSQSSFTRQRGSTLTGLIIGLIVGLGIAVAVALTITKGASPFTDKTVKAGRPADPAPGQAQDPNKPMYANRDAARVANKEITDKAAARSGGSDAAPAPSARPADADPLGQAIAAMKEPAPAPARVEPKPETRVASAAPAAPAAAPAAAAAGGEYIYYLQAGAFRDLSDAEATRAKLALLGFEAAISDRTSDSGVLHRVRLGPYNQVEAMNKARAKLLDSGVDVAIVRNQR